MFGILGQETTSAMADVGVDIGATITESITALGAIVAIAVGGYLAFLVIRRGLAWSGKALR